MKLSKKYILTGVLLLLFIFPATAFAQGVSGSGKVVFGGSYTLRSGERLSGDLTVLAGSAALEEGSEVAGDVLQIGGNLDVAGEIDGTLIFVGGNLELQPTAVVHGDFTHLGGSLQRSPGAQVMGQDLSGMDFSGVLTLPNIVGSQGLLPDLLNSGDMGSLRSFILPEIVVPRLSIDRTADLGELLPNAGLISSGSSLLTLLLRAFAYAILASLVVLFLERPAERARRAATAQPFLAGGLGLVTIVVSVPILTILALTIVLLPLSFFLLILLLALGIFGWIAVGMEVGSRIGTMFGKNWHPALAAGVGVLTLSIARAALSQIPCVDGLMTVLIAAIGIGGLWMTRIGTREYQNPALPPEIES